MRDILGSPGMTQMIGCPSQVRVQVVATVPAAERPADAVQGCQPTPDDRQIGIVDWDNGLAHSNRKSMVRPRLALSPLNRRR